MEIVTITRNLDEVSVGLLAKIAEHDAGEESFPNESATLRRMIREEAKRLALVALPAPARTQKRAPRKTTAAAHLN